MKERKIMERDSSGGVGEFILGLVLLALGVAAIRKIRENHAPHRDFPDSDSPDPEKIPKTLASKVEVLPLNSQITHRKKGNEIIDVKKVIEVKANPLPYHLEKGWQKIRGVHHGYYRCRLGAFKGEIEERPGGDYKFFIFDPPEEVLNGPHAPCFTHVGNNRHHVHFGVNSEDLDSGIMAVERLLYQNLTGR
ncbi:MAG: hypothetical protein Q8N62_03415 [Candidatus Omnitrophota bacterium]|nr:hypothetical protein [Candidatus Omnitrophota bacterium]